MLFRSNRSASDVPGWVACSGVAEGWICLASPRLSEDPLAPAWSSSGEPRLAASVLDSDVCLLHGIAGGAVVWEWAMNEEMLHAYGLGDGFDEGSASQRRHDVVELIADWADLAGLPTVDRERIDEVLEEGYVLADDGFYVLLQTLGICEQGAFPTPTGPWPTPPEPVGEPVLRAPTFPPPRIDHPDPHKLPDASGTIFLAAPLLHDSDAWPGFVRGHLLERWGEPPCLVVASQPEVPPGGLLASIGWTAYLASQPPIVLNSHRGDLASTTRLLHGVTGPWQLVPHDQAESLPDALTWARDHVGRLGAPPAPNREPLVSEVSSPTSPGGAFHDYARERLPRLAFELNTYLELTNRCDHVADWLTEVRDLLVAPATDFAGDTLATHIPPDTDYGPGRTMALHFYGWTVKGRLVMADGDGQGWTRVIRRLRRRELREVGIKLQTLDGAGCRGVRGDISVQVVLRDQFVDVDGPLPDDHPAQIIVSASEELLAATVTKPTETVTAFMQETARRFDAVMDA